MHRSFRLLRKQCVYEVLGIEFLKVVDLLSDTDIFDRDAEFRLDCNGDAALCSTVKLCEDDAGDVSSFHELAGLYQGVLSCSAVEDNESLTVSFRVLFIDDAVDLS